MSKTIIHNRSEKLTDAEACHIVSRYLDAYGVQLKKTWMNIFGKKVFISTGKNKQSTRIIIEDNQQEELKLSLVKKIDKSQENINYEQ